MKTNVKRLHPLPSSPNPENDASSGLQDAACCASSSLSYEEDPFGVGIRPEDMEDRGFIGGLSAPVTSESDVQGVARLLQQMLQSSQGSIQIELLAYEGQTSDKPDSNDTEDS